MRSLLILALLGTVMALSSCVSQEQNSKLSIPGSVPFSPAPGTPVYWPSGSFPLNLKLADAIENNFVAADYDIHGDHLVEQMMKKWDEPVADINFFSFPQASIANLQHSNISSYRDSVMGIYRHDSWFSNVHSTALAVTQYYGIRRNSGSSSEYIEMTHADIIVNFRDFDFSNDASSTSDFDLPSVILHELGHFLGLPHETDYATNAVMLPFFSKIDSYRDITTEDRHDLQELYNRPLTLSAKQALARQPGTNEGEEVHGVIELHANGECRHYENGKLVLTH